MTSNNTIVRNRKSCRLVAAAVVALGMHGVASASIINIESNGAAAEYGLGSYVGTLQYTADVFDPEGTLTVTLANTSDPGNGGFITGFVFNIDSADANASASLIQESHSLDGVANEFAGPFGTFDAGAALGGNFLGNGNPSSGIGVNQTGEFAFLISASDAGSLTAASFLSGPNSHNFVVRFRGFGDEGSDMVPGMLVPAPGALALLALAGIIGTRRRR